MNMLSGNESKLFRNELEIVLEREEWIDAVIEWQSRSGQVVLFRSLLPPQKNGWEMDNARGGVITPQVPMTFFFPAIILPLRFDWPLSPIFTTIAARSRLGPLQDADIRTDPVLQCIYRLTGHHQFLLPWMPRAIERMNFEGFDVVLQPAESG